MFGGHRPPHWETHKRLWWAVPIPQMLGWALPTNWEIDNHSWWAVPTLLCCFERVASPCPLG
jgi:hypothetical protein